MYEGQRFADMVESVRNNGVLVPIVVRPAEDGKFEILSGHNRVAAAKEAGLNEVPGIVREGLNNEEALLIVTETNLIQRSFADMKHSERAIAIAAHHKATKHQGKRTDLLAEIDELLGTSRPSGIKLNSKKLIGDKYEISSRTISRYLRINELVPKLKERLDNDEFAIRVGEALSFLKKKEQEMVNSFLAIGEHINIKQSDVLKQESQKGQLSKAFIKSVFEPDFFGTKVKSVKFGGQFLSQYFNETQSAEEIENVMTEALKQYFASKQV
jgi:ParB family chromosome partitioning protein